MSQFLVNGIEHGWPLAGEVTVAEVLDYIQKNYNSDRTLVSNVKINGQEISAQEEQTLAPMRASTLQSIEVLTAHPRELAEETLQALIPFTEHLAQLALRNAGTQGAGTGSEADFRKLIDALGTFSEAIDSVRGVLQMGGNMPADPLHAIDELEAGMIGVLKRIMKAKESGKGPEVAALLGEDLVANLSAWHDHGIPQLIRSRDS